ncbi:MAG: hypothetical protein LBD67_08025 [Candidatus Accumulibacter sp.]|nr:hypothetical protein [Accumulibacter sp.]
MAFLKYFLISLLRQAQDERVGENPSVLSLPEHRQRLFLLSEHIDDAYLRSC